MASFFYQDDAEPQQEAANGRHLKSIQGGKPAVRAQSSEWQDAAVAPTAERRMRVAPPDLFARSPSTLWNWVTQAWAWLWDMDELPRRPAPTTGMGKARAEFHSAIWDLQSLKANQLRDGITHARSLRELWHLRADVFKLISMHRGQAEAQARLDLLDAHFPVRSSQRQGARSGKVASW